MGQPGRQLADGREPLADAGALLQCLQVSEVLEEQELAGFPSRCSAQGGQVASQDAPAPVADVQDHLEPVLPALAPGQGIRQLEQVLDRGPGVDGHAQDGPGRGVRGGDPALQVERDQSRAHGLDHPLVEGGGCVDSGLAGAEVDPEPIRVPPDQDHKEGRREDLQGGCAQQEREPAGIGIHELAGQAERGDQARREPEHQDDVGERGGHADPHDLGRAQVEGRSQHREDVEGGEALLHHALEGDDERDQGQVQGEVPADPGQTGRGEEAVHGRESARRLPDRLDEHQQQRGQVGLLARA